jgi:hypothetical protein
MSKHVIDGPRSGGESERVKPYLGIERQTGGPGRREKALHHGAASAGDKGERVREFLRIERAAPAED